MERKDSLLSPNRPIILPACSSMKWDKTIYGNTYNTVISLIEAIPSVNILYCLPDEEAARVCHKAISINQTTKAIDQ